MNSSSPRFSALILILSWLSLLISASYSPKCSSQTFSNKKSYDNCTDLPELDAFLYWTYNTAKSTLSIAFIAPPEKPRGWIAWAINPTSDGMIGAQSLIGFLDQNNGSMTVKTYTIDSYTSISESNLSFDVLEKSGESSDGVMRIFATLALPETMTTVNQVWQVGGSVDNGIPMTHEFRPGNMNSKGTLELGKAEENRTTVSPIRSPASARSTSTHSGGISSIRTIVGTYAIFFLIGFSILGV